MALRNAFENLATEAKQDAIKAALDSILTELNAKLEAGQAVALDSATLSALESVTATVSNWPTDYPDSDSLAKLEAIRALLAGTVAVSAASLPLPDGAATEVTLSSIDAKTPPLMTGVPNNSESAPPSRLVGQDITTASFCPVSSDGVLSQEMTQIIKGTGVTVTQASGNLLVAMGTTAKAEFMARSNKSWQGSWILHQKTTLSQRIANNNFLVLMADVIGDNLEVTANSATSITVTKVGHGFTSANVGQYMFIGNIVGLAGVPGRYAIASIPSDDTINFTVASWPASGSGTVNLFGWNHVKFAYSGTSATSAYFDAQRQGWASGDTTITVNTTASGHMGLLQNDGRFIMAGDSAVSSSATYNISSRGARQENIPDDNTNLYLIYWAYNGTTAPASTTTWTSGFWSLERYANLPVYIAGNRPQGTNVMQGVTVNNQPSVTLASTTVVPSTSLGHATYHTAVNLATANATSVKSSAGIIGAITISNNGSVPVWFKLFNLAAAPTMGTSSPVHQIMCPAGGTVSVYCPDTGWRHSTGISYALTLGIALLDNTVMTVANTVTVSILYT